MQPWEFGSLPKAWIQPLQHEVDEVWVPTNWVRSCFIQSGVPADRVHVVPNGVDVDLLQRKQSPFRCAPRSVSSSCSSAAQSIARVPISCCAYTETFTAVDDVCLVIKDVGGASYYQGQTAEKQIAALQTGSAPEIEYLTDDLSAEEMAGLYQACQCLVHPYRGEGFGLPIAEAMACGLAVIVTGYGAALDFCDDTRAFLVPARLARFNAKSP